MDPIYASRAAHFQENIFLTILLPKSGITVLITFDPHFPLLFSVPVSPSLQFPHYFLNALVSWTLKICVPPWATVSCRLFHMCWHANFKSKVLDCDNAMAISCCFAALDTSLCALSHP